MNSERDPARAGGCPIRTSLDQSLLAAPQGLSQRATSFIASWRQGIHRMPFSCSPHLLHSAHQRRTPRTSAQRRIPAQVPAEAENPRAEPSLHHTRTPARTFMRARVRKHAQSHGTPVAPSPARDPIAHVRWDPPIPRSHEGQPSDHSPAEHPRGAPTLIHIAKDHNARHHRTTNPGASLRRNPHIATIPRTLRSRDPWQTLTTPGDGSPGDDPPGTNPVETAGLEPATPCLQSRCSPS